MTIFTSDMVNSRRNAVLFIVFFWLTISIIVLFWTLYGFSTLPENRKIPRIVHLSWKSREIPEDTAAWIRKWKEVNPGWEVWFWDDRTSGEFVRRQFPNLQKVYDRYPKAIYRSDMVRYLWLFKYGGVWSDLDIEPLQSLEPIREQYPCILSREHEIHTRKWNVDMMACNAYMMCRKEHPLFSLILDMLETNQNHGYPITATGPLMLTTMYNAYAHMRVLMPYEKAKIEDDVKIADVAMFMPRSDKLSVNKLKIVCQDGTIKERYRYLCKKTEDYEFLGRPSGRSYVDHHWWHSWLKNGGGKRESVTVSIKTILPDVFFPEPGKDF